MFELQTRPINLGGLLLLLRDDVFQIVHLAPGNLARGVAFLVPLFHPPVYFLNTF
jgi:hypothetical protein